MYMCKATRSTKRKLTVQAFKLKELRVILHDVALHPEIIPHRYKQSFQQQLKRITKSSYISTLRNPNNIQLPNLYNANVRNTRFVMESLLQNTVKRSRGEYRTTKSRVSNKNIKLTKEISKGNNEIVESKPLELKQRIIDSIDKFSRVTNQTRHRKRIDSESSSGTSDQMRPKWRMIIDSEDESSSVTNDQTRRKRKMVIDSEDESSSVTNDETMKKQKMIIDSEDEQYNSITDNQTSHEIKR